jgi:ABC-2 type transport system permease protein
VMTGEHSSGMIRATLAAIPNRPLVLAAKAAVFGVVALAAGEAAGFIAFFAGTAALPGGIPGPELGQPGVLRAVVLGGAGFCLVGLIGLGLGAIIRHTPAAIAVLVGGVYVLAQFVALLTHSLMGYLPIGIVANSLTAVQPMTDDQVRFLSPWAGLGMLCLYAAGTLGVGAWLLARRDA